MATAFVWDGAGANNWNTDHWGRGGVAPAYPGAVGSAVGDTIEIDGSVNDPATQPGAPLTVAEYTCYGGAFDCGANLTVTDVLTMGTAAVLDTPVFGGTAAGGCIVLFQGGSSNTGFVGNYATFNDSAINNGGTAGDFATFNDTAYNNGGVVGDYATFNDTAYNNAGGGVVGDYATFNDTAYNNGGVVGDYATFNDTAYNNGGVVGDFATFNDASYVLTGGSVGDEATFNSTGTFAGEFTGTQYYCQAPTVIDNTNEFTGVAPIVFSLTTTTASLTGKLLDGIANPLEFFVEILASAVADLIATNLRNGKTVLGVAGTVTLSGWGPYSVGSVAVGPFPIGAASIGPFPVV